MEFILSVVEGFGVNSVEGHFQVTAIAFGLCHPGR